MSEARKCCMGGVGVVRVCPLLQRCTAGPTTHIISCTRGALAPRVRYKSVVTRMNLETQPGNYFRRKAGIRVVLHNKSSKLFSG
jgi:hypothetical protein